MSPPPDRNTDAGCGTAPFPCHGAAPAAGSPGGCPAGCTPAAYCARDPALRPRPPDRSGSAGHWRAKVSAVVDGDALLLLFSFPLQLHLHLHLHLHILHAYAWRIGAASHSRAKVSAATVQRAVQAYFATT